MAPFVSENLWLGIQADHEQAQRLSSDGGDPAPQSACPRKNLRGGWQASKSAPSRWRAPRVVATAQQSSRYCYVASGHLDGKRCLNFVFRRRGFDHRERSYSWRVPKFPRRTRCRLNLEQRSVHEIARCTAMAVLAKMDVAFATERRVAAFGSAAARLMRAYATQVEVFRRLRMFSLIGRDPTRGSGRPTMYQCPSSSIRGSLPNGRRKHQRFPCAPLSLYAAALTLSNGRLTSAISRAMRCTVPVVPWAFWRGHKHPRAHRLIKDDPERALEFIAFVSLLAKLLDGAPRPLFSTP